MAFIFLPNSNSRVRLSLYATLMVVAGNALAGSRQWVMAQSGPSRLPTVFSPDQVAWDRELGLHQYTVPRADDGVLFIGVDDSGLEHPAVSSTGGGIVMCLDRETGRTIWQLPIPRYMDGTNPPFHFNHWKCGVCSRPALDGDRLYVVGPRGDVLCLDRDGQADGNRKPFVDEKRYMGLDSDTDYELSRKDGDIIWQYDMIEQLGVVPHDVCGSSPTVHGDFVYACTSNGVDHTHGRVANPDAPSLIALHKRTGKLAAVDGADIGERILHGQWSSPVVATFNGHSLVLFGGGDGVLYAFKALEKGKETVAEELEIAWQYDCCPESYRRRGGRPLPYARWNQNRSGGPSEIIATPTVYDGRIYVAIGQSPLHGPGKGVLSCIDGASGRLVWESRQVDRALSDAVVHDGLVYIADYSGQLHCLDAASGKHYWQHDLAGGVWCATPIVVQGRIYISNEKNRMWVLRAGRRKQVISRGRTRSMAITPVRSGNLLFVPTQRRLFALRIDEHHSSAEQ